MADRTRHSLTHIQQPPQNIEQHEPQPATDAPPHEPERTMGAAGTLPPNIGTDAPPQSGGPSGVTTDAPPQGDNAPSAPEDASLQVGERPRQPLRAPVTVAYGDGKQSLRYNHAGEWLPAETATHDDLHNPLPPPAEGHRHLLVALDPERHNAAGDRALRLNVPEGGEVGQFRGA